MEERRKRRVVERKGRKSKMHNRIKSYLEVKHSNLKIESGSTQKSESKGHRMNSGTHFINAVALFK